MHSQNKKFPTTPGDIDDLPDEWGGSSTDPSKNCPSASSVPVPRSAVTGSSSGLTSSSWFGNQVRKLWSKLSISVNRSEDCHPDDDDVRSPVSTTTLEEGTLEWLKQYIGESGRCKRIIVMAGAGISTSAGIPDFRSPITGIYAGVLTTFKLSSPEQIFDINYFNKNPKPFFDLAKTLIPKKMEPTWSHQFIRFLEEKNLLLRLYTQNIDGLERMVGVPDDKIVEAHGTFFTSHCTKKACHAEYSFEWMKDKIMGDILPRCPQCDSVVKPDVVFFGEPLPQKFFRCAEQDFKNCDLLIVMGTSLTVQPFASMIDRVPQTCPRLLVNRTQVSGYNPKLIRSLVRNHGDQSGDIDLREVVRQNGFNFGGGGGGQLTRRFDLALLTDCDEGCLKLAGALGWADEVERFIENQKSAVENKAASSETTTVEM